MGDTSHDRVIELMLECNWERANEECDAQLRVQPLTGRLHFSKGVCLSRLDRKEEAEQSLNRAYMLDPSLTEAAVLRAQCLEKLHRVREAMDLVKEVLPLRPNDRVLEGLALYLSQFYQAEEHDNWEKSRRFEAKSRRSNR